MVNTGQNRVKKAKGILGKKAENVASRDERSRVKTAASAKQAETPSVKAKDRPGVKVKSVTPRDERSRVRLAVDEDIHDFPVENDVPAESRTERDHAKKAKGIVLDKDETVYVGVDVHLRSYSVAVWSVQQGKVVTCWTQPAEMEKLLDRLAPVKAHVAQVVYEAGPTGYCLVRRLRAEGFQADVIATSKMLRTVCVESKSDRLDCRRLAEHAAKRLLKAVYVPTEQEERDRQILRLREQMVRRCRVARQQIKSFLMTHSIPQPAGLKNWTLASLQTLRKMKLPSELRYCLDVLLDEQEHALKQVRLVTEKVKALAADRRHRASVKILQTVPGVGPITAMTFRVELPNAGRFDNGGEVARMVGLAPNVQESGDRRREGKLLKGGNKLLRSMLIEAAWRWVYRDPVAEKHYRRLVSNTGDSRKAIVGVARKLAILLWRMSTRGEKYRHAEKKAA